MAGGEDSGAVAAVFVRGRATGFDISA
jgi:hypothetical protein